MSVKNAHMSIGERLAGGKYTAVVLQPQYLVYFILLMLVAVATMFFPGFLGTGHIAAMLRLASFLGIVCIGQNLVMLTGGFDISVPATITLGNVVGAGILMGNDANIPLALLAVLLVGAAAGIVIALGITAFNIPPFIMTLGMGSVIMGAALIFTGGAPIGRTSPLLTTFTSSNLVGPFSGTVVLWVVMALIFMMVMRYTTFGRHVRALGANATAARFSGVPTKKTRALAFITASMLYAFTGFLLVGFTGTTHLEIGLVYHPNNIAAVIIGGTSVRGGRGGYLGTFGGVLIMIVLTNFLALLHIPESMRQIINGLILISLIVLYAREKER